MTQNPWDAEAATFDEQPDHGLRDPDVRAAWAELLLPLLPSEAFVADLGCGTGTLAVLLAEAGHRVVGVDLSERMLDQARQKAGAGVEFKHGDAADPPLDDYSFDVVLVRHVLWAMPDQSAAVGRWLRLLKPGGRLVLVEGRWSTGAGISADECRALFGARHVGTRVRVLDDPAFWGAEIEDERYLVVAEPGPVYRTTSPRGWVVTGYAEARAALSDPRLRKAGANARWAGRPAGRGSHMLDADPPDHTRLRKLVNQAFTARAVEALRPRIEEITAALLDDLARHDEVDLLAAFAVPLPITVIGELLGVEPGARAEFHRLSRDLGDPGLRTFLGELVRAKRARPADDVLSRLVLAHDRDDRLSDTELVATAFLLLFAGYETTVHLIGNGVYALLRNPDQFDALRADPALVPAAVEEFLRFGGPVGFATLRYTGEPVELGGVRIPADEFVHVALGAANRDPARFADPGRLDLARHPAGHVGFGHGIHHCVGAPLARLEAQIAFTQLVRRFPRLSLAGDVRWQDGIRIHGLVELPVRPNE
ncbi:cytochrome P450 [Amycolatopsis sp. NPDC088138]|uniref:cytochrome P450 n=1 Tax=Amycolatopsis sp. NPDC088138 TaxID=3363938 RepID=UPI00381527A7